MKKILSLTLAVGMMAMTISPAIGVTIEELQAQIALLMAQLQALQGTQGGAYNFTRDLTIGSRGDDVTALQNYLASTGHFTYAGGATGYFGPITKAAVAAWQAANGISPASGYFGPISRAKYTALVGEVTPTPAPSEEPTPTPSGEPTPTPTPSEEPEEGSLEVKLNPSPANNTEIDLGGTAKAVMAFDAKAKDSSITIRRVDVQFGTQRPWLAFSHVGLYDGDNAIVGITPTSANSYEFSTTNFGIRFTGLNFTVPKGTTKTITVKVSALGAITGMTTDLTRTVTIPSTGIRFTDSAGISHAETGTTVSRDFIIKYTATGTLELALNANTPEERVVAVSDTSTTENIEALRLDLKAKTTDATLKRLTVKVDSTGTNFGSAAKLYDGDTLLASESISDGYATFTDLTVALTKNAIKTLTVKVDAIKAPTATSSGTLTVSYANLFAEDVHYNEITSITGSATGKKIHFYVKAPQFALVSASLTANTDKLYLASGNIRVNVTAVGGDVYISTSTTDGIVAKSLASSTAYNVTSVSGTTLGSWGWKIASGQTGVFDVAVNLNNQSGTAGFYSAWLSKVTWNTTDSATDAVSWTDKLGFGSDTAVGNATLKTSAVYLTN